MPNQKKLIGKPISKILAPETGLVVGWVYRWDDGTLQERWFGEQELGSGTDPFSFSADDRRGQAADRYPRRRPQAAAR